MRRGPSLALGSLVLLAAAAGCLPAREAAVAPAGAPTPNLRPATPADWTRLPADGPGGGCLAPLRHAPDTAHLDFWPIHRVRLAYRVVDRESHRLNLDTATGPERLRAITSYANRHLEDLPRAVLPRRAPPPRTRARFRLALSGEEWVSFHDDEEVPRHVHKGPRQNIGHGLAFQRYGARADSTLNVVLLPFELAAGKRASRPGAVGVAIGSRYLKLVAHWSAYDVPWDFHRTLLHEVAHVFTVGHTWAQDDGCDDTPRHRPCWNLGEPAGCDTADLSNNLMDYTAIAAALTPCQVGRIHAAIAREGSRQRAYVEPAWCEGSGRPDIDLRDTFVVRRATDLDAGVVLHAGAYLEVRCRLSIPAGRRITVLPGSTLALAGGRLHNACDLTWAGVHVGVDGGRRGELLWREGSSLEDLALPPDDPTPRS